VKRELHALVLALVGGTLLKLVLTGDYARYVKVSVRPYLTVAAVVLLVVAGATLLTRRPSTVSTVPTVSTVDDGHGHGHGRFDVAWLLVVPMLVVLLLAPPALGSFSAARSGTALGAGPASQLPALPGGDPVRLSVLDYASRAVFDHGRTLTGRHVTLSGFVQATDDHTGWYLIRLVITCCAADAQPVKVGLSGTLPPGLADNQWLEFTGAYTDRQDHDPVNGEAIPYLSVESSRPIPTPAHQYES
jgi:putative membrane protein